MNSSKTLPEELMLTYTVNALIIIIILSIYDKVREIDASVATVGIAIIIASIMLMVGPYIVYTLKRVWGSKVPSILADQLRFSAINSLIMLNLTALLMLTVMFLSESMKPSVDVPSMILYFFTIIVVTIFLSLTLRK